MFPNFVCRCYLDGVVCQGIAIHAMQTRNPNGEYVFPRIATELLSSRQPPSLRWCRNLMFQNYLVSRKPTSARRRDLTPDTVSSQKTDFAARIALLVHLYKIPPHLIFHWDQTGIPVCLIGNRSRASQGVSHVPLYGAHETRLVTGNPFYNMDGIFLAFQVIFNGKDKSRCLPSNSATCAAAGVISTCSESHWSTVSTQKDLLHEVLNPYLQSVADSQGVSSHGLTFILLIDCYSTHTCVEFVAFFKNYYNGVDNAKGFLVFTPPGLTFTANPADLTVQSKTKGLLKQMSAYSIAKSFLEQKDLDNRLSILKPHLL